MKYAYTIVEWIISIAIAVIVMLVLFGGLTGQCNLPESPYGHNLKLVSVDYTEATTKWRWEDVNTGETFYSYDSDATTNYRDIEHE